MGSTRDCQIYPVCKQLDDVWPWWERNKFWNIYRGDFRVTGFSVFYLEPYHVLKAGISQPLLLLILTIHSNINLFFSLLWGVPMLWKTTPLQVTVSAFPYTRVIARLGHLTRLLPLSQYTNTRGEWIYWWKYVRLHHSRSWYAPFQLLTPGPSSSWPITVKTWMTLRCCTLHNIHCINTVIVVFFFCFSPASLTDLCHRWLPGQCPAGGLWWYAQNTK